MTNSSDDLVNRLRQLPIPAGGRILDLQRDLRLAQAQLETARKALEAARDDLDYRSMAKAYTTICEALQSIGAVK